MLKFVSLPKADVNDLYGLFSLWKDTFTIQFTDSKVKHVGPPKRWFWAFSYLLSCFVYSFG